MKYGIMYQAASEKRKRNKQQRKLWLIASLYGIVGDSSALSLQAMWRNNNNMLRAGFGVAIM